MKQALNSKLHSQRGASILVALMFFLVCAMVAAVILGSATTNAQKNQQRREEQQVYYSVSSAAKLLRDTVKQLSYEGGETAEHYGCNDNHFGTDDQYIFKSIDPEREQDKAEMTPITAKRNGNEADTGDLLAELLAEGVQAVYQSRLELATNEKQPFTSWSKSFTIDDGKYTVDVTVSIDKNYTLTFQLTPQDEAFRDDYGMTLVCDGKSYSTETTETVTCTHNVTLQSLTETEPTTTMMSFEVTKKTNTTTVSWEPGMIYKGANSNG